MGNMCPAFIWCTDKYGIPRGLGKVHPFALEVELVIAVSICGTTVHHVWDTRVLVQYFCVVYFLTSGWPFGGHLLVLIAPCTQCAWSLLNGHGPNQPCIPPAPAPHTPPTPPFCNRPTCIFLSCACLCSACSSAKVRDSLENLLCQVFLSALDGHTIGKSQANLTISLPACDRPHLCFVHMGREVEQHCSSYLSPGKGRLVVCPMSTMPKRK